VDILLPVTYLFNLSTRIDNASRSLCFTVGENRIIIVYLVAKVTWTGDHHRRCQQLHLRGTTEATITKTTTDVYEH